ncbi:hypothetical protein [Nitrosomonas sp.]|uniref:hypothetical protein n=1 Tax=Nitrosomonas sp. TaxID=42353 RepID=UPI002848E34B|nr:hypothetical protein [Nitrosomonas sp.]MCP5242750.1 hypothetical protein [Burkholderiales bacterium]MCP5292407.1 hypothetical protein [Burkholderiales bacterium]MDR4515555.1 hypothetical protein [Nitrosomonas sp.]
MKKLFIHIGLPKTATSYIQHFLFNNGDFLNKNGYHYVSTGLNNDLHCHHDLVWKLGLHSGPGYVCKDIRKHSNKTLAGLATEHAQHSDKHLIISSELLTFLDDFKELEPLLSIFKNRAIRFIVNLRRQDSFLESLYLQVVKDGVGDTFQTWYHKARKIADYNLLINNILQVTQKDSLRIGIFGSGKKERNPAEDFLSSIGLDDKTFIVENRFQNVRLAAACIKIIRISNSLNLKINYKLVDFFTRHKERFYFLNNHTAYLSVKQRKAIRNAYRASNQALTDRIELPLHVKQEILSW